MIEAATYLHTNLIASDWRALAQFYCDVFGCTRVPPERDYSGAELEGGTGMPGNGLRGVHVRLPGGGDAGPTLEIFQYSSQIERAALAINRPGYGHIAFRVGNVRDAHAEVLARGGSSVGEIVDVTTPDGSLVTWCYVQDPEGNVIELQSTA